MNEMKKILLIGTGGTIASDVTDSGLAPELTTEQLLSHIPGISDICGVDCLQLLNLDSTNMTPAHWLEIGSSRLRPCQAKSTMYAASCSLLTFGRSAQYCPVNTVMPTSICA